MYLINCQPKQKKKKKLCVPGHGIKAPLTTRRLFCFFKAGCFELKNYEKQSEEMKLFLYSFYSEETAIDGKE